MQAGTAELDALREAAEDEAAALAASTVAELAGSRAEVRSLLEAPPADLAQVLSRLPLASYLMSLVQHELMAGRPCSAATDSHLRVLLTLSPVPCWCCAVACRLADGCWHVCSRCVLCSEATETSLTG